MRIFIWSIVGSLIGACALTSGVFAQEVGISSDGRELIEKDGRVFERVDDMLLEYQGLGLESVQPVDVRLWPDGILPIEFEAGYNQADQAAFFEACELWSAVSRVTCVPRNNQTDFIRVVAGTRNASYVGRIPGGQELELFNRRNQGIIAHEIAHALGFAHQHNSPERDTYIEVKWGNIIPEARHNYRRVPQAKVFGFYDFCSVMHYPLNAFSSNGQPTIVVKGNPIINCTIGQRQDITIEDSMGMAAAYGRDQEDRLFVEVPNFIEFSHGATNPDWAYSRFGLRTAIVAGETRDECVRHTICETTCYRTEVSNQDPTEGTLVEFGTTVNLTTYVFADYQFYIPPGQQCP